MKLTTRGRYAVTAMADLVMNSEDGEPVCLGDIAGRQGLSTAYLEQLFIGLRRAGLVEGVRGPCGGYRLARSAAEINVAQIIAAVDEPVDATRCGGARNCQSGDACLTHDLWAGLSDHIEGYLQSVTLADLGRTSSAPAEQPLRYMQA